MKTVSTWEAKVIVAVVDVMSAVDVGGDVAAVAETHWKQKVIPDLGGLIIFITHHCVVINP